jgi:hypothetical protein
MIDRRDEVKNVPWQQGHLLYTQQVLSMPKDWQAAAEQEEQRRLFAHFYASDQGRGRELLFCFDTAEECAAAVEAHNAELARIK